MRIKIESNQEKLTSIKRDGLIKRVETTTSEKEEF